MTDQDLNITNYKNMTELILNIMVCVQTTHAVSC